MAIKISRLTGLAEQADVNTLWSHINATIQGLHTQCGWSPFSGMTARGQVRRVIHRGQVVFQDGKIKTIY